jgi:DNA-binding NarL/FixJ family response regulator
MPYTRTDAAAPLRVLVVDDCRQLRDSIRMALESAGLLVVGEAGDGVEALAEAAVRNPDVVLMDLAMPGMDGVEATRFLRRQRPHTPVVLWSGEDDARLAAAIRRSGAHAGVPKGVSAGNLVAALRAACQSRVT